MNEPRPRRRRDGPRASSGPAATAMITPPSGGTAQQRRRPEPAVRTRRAAVRPSSARAAAARHRASRPRRVTAARVGRPRGARTCSIAVRADAEPVGDRVPHRRDRPRPRRASTHERRGGHEQRGRAPASAPRGAAGRGPRRRTAPVGTTRWRPTLAEHCVELLVGVALRHRGTSVASSSVRKRAIARDRRDFTVPTRQCRVSAMSISVIPSKWRSAITSRSALESRFIASTTRRRSSSAIDRVLRGDDGRAGVGRPHAQLGPAGRATAGRCARSSRRCGRTTDRTGRSVW